MKNINLNKPELVDLQRRVDKRMTPDLIDFVILEGLGHISNDKVEKFHKIRNIGFEKDKDFKDAVILTVNGIQLPFEKSLKAAEIQFDKLVEEKAKELITERLGDLNGDLARLEYELKNLITKSSLSD